MEEKTRHNGVLGGVPHLEFATPEKQEKPLKFGEAELKKAVSDDVYDEIGKFFVSELSDSK